MTNRKRGMLGPKLANKKDDMAVRSAGGANQRGGLLPEER